jgi:hypothetical protein
VFTFPKSAIKQLVVKNENIPNTNDNLSEEKSKMIVSHFETVIVKLIKDLIVLDCTPLSSILALNLSLPVFSCFVALTLFLKDAMVFS